MVTNEPIVPPVTTTETPMLVPDAAEVDEVAKAIFPPAWITPVLARPPTVEVPVEPTTELTEVVGDVSATQPTDVSATAPPVAAPKLATVGTSGAPSVSALVPRTRCGTSGVHLFCGAIFVVVTHFKKLDFLMLSSMGYVLINSFIVYFLNRLLYSMCVGSLK